jgi:hypothetical protein
MFLHVLAGCSAGVIHRGNIDELIGEPLSRVNERSDSIIPMQVSFVSEAAGAREQA